MNNSQEQDYLMFQVLNETSQRHAPTAKWPDHGAFNATYIQWLARVDTLRRLRLDQAQETTGITLDKTALRRQMCDHTLIIADAVRADAVAQHDEELAAKAKLTCSPILYGKQADAVTICQNLHNRALAAPLAQPLIPYGVTTSKLAELQENIANFADAIPRPRTTIKSRKSVTQQIAEEFAAADMLLTEGLDRLIGQFKKTAPEFVKDFQNARVPVAKAATLKSKKSKEKAAATPQSAETPRTAEAPNPPEASKRGETPKPADTEPSKMA